MAVDLLLHYQSHVNNRYKKGLLRTMLDRPHRLFSSWTHFSDECDRLKTVVGSLSVCGQSPLRKSAVKKYIKVPYGKFAISQSIL